MPTRARHPKRPGKGRRVRGAERANKGGSRYNIKGGGEETEARAPRTGGSLLTIRTKLGNRHSGALALQSGKDLARLALHLLLGSLPSLREEFLIKVLGD